MSQSVPWAAATPASPAGARQRTASGGEEEDAGRGRPASSPSSAPERGVVAEPAAEPEPGAPRRARSSTARIAEARGEHEDHEEEALEEDFAEISAERLAGGHAGWPLRVATAEKNLVQ